METKPCSEVLFLFTKEYPFLWKEKYIDHELPRLSESFGKIVLVPTEFYGNTETQKVTSSLPANVEVFDLNRLIRQSGITASSVILQAMRIWLYEFIANPARKFLVRHFRKNLNVLSYQLIAAHAFHEYLGKQPNRDYYFYTYWLHHSTLMLGAMKQKGWISKYVTRAHSIDLYNEDWVHAGDIHKPLPYQVFKIKFADHVFAISDHGCNFLKNKYTSWRDKFSRMYLGVADNGEGPAERIHDFTVVTCSVCNKNKRVDMVPAVLSQLPFPSRWIHFGSGGDGEDDIRKAIAALPGHVKVDMRGSVSNSEIIQFYRANKVDLFVNLSLAEGVPVSIMEAISFGVPVLATNVYGTPELISNNNGYLVKVTDSVETIAGKVAEFAGNADLQLRMRKASRELFLREFDNAVTTKQFTESLRRFKSNHRTS